MILTPKQKIVYRLRKDGKRQEDIAHAVGLSQQAVSRLLQRAQQNVQAFVANCPGGARCEALDALLN